MNRLCVSQIRNVTFAILGLLAIVQFLPAQELVIPPAEDVMTSAFFTGDDRVRGYLGDGRAIHRVSSDNAFGTGPETVYIQFDQLDFIDLTPPVDSATLTLTSTDGQFGANAGPGNPFLVSAHGMDEDPLLSITDNTNPSGPIGWFDFFSNNILESNKESLTAIEEFGPVTFDVTTLVNDWLTGMNANYSIAVTAKNDPQTANGGSGFLHGFVNNTEAPGSTFLTITVEDILLGDVNCDGEVNLLDVSPFVDLLSNGGFNDKADINGDEEVNLLDVGPFVEILSN
ncbi:MAG: hypothetical protein AAGA30_03405 [Planctomycetota bacterium]